MMVMAQGETFSNKKVGNRSVASQSEITWDFYGLDVFQKDSPFSTEVLIWTRILGQAVKISEYLVMKTCMYITPDDALIVRTFLL